jgi:hypothetical protein
MDAIGSFSNELLVSPPPMKIHFLSLSLVSIELYVFVLFSVKGIIYSIFKLSDGENSLTHQRERRRTNGILGWRIRYLREKNSPKKKEEGNVVEESNSPFQTRVARLAP